ncbi:hypothetical protein BVJ60_17500 [Vibrio cholerae]|nr:hypothetical protein [Vibrio cholerae]
MNYGQSVNNLTGSGHWLSKLLLCLLLCAHPASADDTVVQLSMAQLEGPRMKDGYLIGRGRIICAGEHSGFRIWMAPQYLTPDQQSYILPLVESQITRSFLAKYITIR